MFRILGFALYITYEVGMGNKADGFSSHSFCGYNFCIIMKTLEKESLKLNKDITPPLHCAGP